MQSFVIISLNIFPVLPIFYSFCYPDITNVKSLVLIQQVLDVLYMYYFLCSSLENFYSVFNITDSLLYHLYFVYNPLCWGFVFIFFSSKLSINVFLISTIYFSFLMILLIFWWEFLCDCVCVCVCFHLLLGMFMFSYWSIFMMAV